MVGLDQQSAPKQLNNEVPSHAVMVNNKVGALKGFSHLFSCQDKPALSRFHVTCQGKCGFHTNEKGFLSTLSCVACLILYLEENLTTFHVLLI